MRTSPWKLGIFLFCAGSALAAEAVPVCRPCSPREAGSPEVLLKNGNRRFVTNAGQHPRSDVACIRNMAEQNCQAPFAVVLTCSDSRFPPEVLFDQGIGDLFVVREAGNVATPEVLGSIEYAIEHLHVRYVVVLGHEKCGAVRAAFEPNLTADHLDSLWMRIRPSVPGPFNSANWQTAVRNHLHATVEQLKQNLRVGDIHDTVIVGAYASLTDGSVQLPVE